MEKQKFCFEKWKFKWHPKNDWTSHDGHVFSSQKEKSDSNHQCVSQIERDVENSYAERRFFE